MGSHFRNARDHNELTAQEANFAQAYVLCRNPLTAALSAGYPARIAITEGVSLLANPGVQQKILASFPYEEDRAAFEHDWGLDLLDDPTDHLVERIQAAREKLALDARGGLPLPAEITFTRKPPSRRSRATKHKEA